MIAAQVNVLEDDVQSIKNLRVHRAHSLLRSVAREEAGKFLVLLDMYRCPEADQSLRSRQYSRAGNHLAKLIYAEAADARIASQEEMLRLVNFCRQGLYLDGPNDYDLIFRNQPLQDRDSVLYVDLLEVEDSVKQELIWWQPYLDSSSDPPLPNGDEVHIWRSSTPQSVKLVHTIDASGLLTETGLAALSDAWAGFDAREDSHCTDWQTRTGSAFKIASLPIADEAIREIADLWPMPLVEIDLSEIQINVEDLVEERERRFAVEMYGDLTPGGGDYW